MCFVALDGTFVRINRRMCEILGYSEAELVGTTCIALTHPDDIEVERKNRERLLAAPDVRASTWDKRFLRRDGSIVWCSLTLTVLVDDRGAPEQFVVVVEDLSERKRAAQMLEESESLLRIAGHTAHLGGWALDLATEMITWSDEACAILDIPTGSVLSRAATRAFYKADSIGRLIDAATRSESSGESFDLELELVTANGRDRWVRVIGQLDRAGARLVGAIQDITERKTSELELIRMNRALKMLSGCNEVLVRATDERMLLSDIARLIVDVGGYTTVWAGYARDDERRTIEPIAIAGEDNGYVGRARLSWHESDAHGRGAAGRTIRSGAAVVIEDVETDEGFEPWRDAALANGYRSVIGLPLRDATRTFGLLALYAGDVRTPPQAELDLLLQLADDLAFGIGHLRTQNERIAAERAIAHLAFNDPLTDLPNRTALVQRLKALLATCESFGALLFIDLDNFKTLNDTLGHHTGDLLLASVARRLRACVPTPHTVARLGGDEFIIMLEGVGDRLETATNRARAVADDVLASFREPYALDGHAYSCTPSIGVTIFDGSDNVDDLLKEADLAMYQAKAAGRNAIHFFIPQMQVAVTWRRALEADLQAALDRDEFTLVYQPQVDVDEKVIGAEALVRWTHPTRGAVLPGEFISVAEECGLILPLGRSILRMACAQLVAWAREPALAELKLSVNVSAREFRYPEFVDGVVRVLAASGANPRRLVLELTESVFVDEIDVIIAKMGALRKIGVDFSLDDFGTGYSSLAYLKSLPLRQLKIDQSFVRDVLIDSNDAVIAQTIVALARNLSLDVIAEGVESVEQFGFLVEAGCRSFQGYYFSRPLSSEAFVRRVVRRTEALESDPNHKLNVRTAFIGKG
ncbi:MAG: hypothetical protein NVS4B5_11520 [Vulcanimicrobiaceae bacterium]